MLISRTFKTLLSKATAAPTYAFSSHDEPPPTSLPKVSEVVINMYIRNKFNVVERVQAFEGESLFEAIVRNKVHAYGDPTLLCNGYDLIYRPHYRPHDNDCKGPNCGNCRVVLEDNWFERVHEETDGYNDMEERILNSQLDPKTYNRLSCCIPVEKWMEGLTCSVDLTPQESEETVLL